MADGANRCQSPIWPVDPDLLALGANIPQTIGTVEGNIRLLRAHHNEISSATDAVSGLRATLAAFR